MEEKQMVMHYIMATSLNENAMPVRHGQETEFTVNNHILNNYKRYKLTRHQYLDLIKRQLYLQKQLEK
jgi:hypothetical protein